MGTGFRVERMAGLLMVGTITVTHAVLADLFEELRIDASIDRDALTSGHRWFAGSGRPATVTR